MILEEIKNIKSEKKDLRNFGLVMAVFFGLLGAWMLWRERDSFVYMFIIAGFFLIGGLALPIILKPLQKAWMTFAVLMGWLMTRVILGILFYLVFTPMGLIARLFGKDFLDMKLDKNASSYWIEKKVEQGERNYEHQF
ncbi:MAG: hypothetical protein K9H64_18575 [Bacteroidales bacterium]|nr:hypothetical protein [Bacteroidales bacterium]MCF8458044.1 hypothetical protein [Bacteroidales bacterium]